MLKQTTTTLMIFCNELIVSLPIIILIFPLYRMYNIRSICNNNYCNLCDNMHVNTCAACRGARNSSYSVFTPLVVFLFVSGVMMVL